MEKSLNPLIGEDKSAYCEAISTVFASYRFHFRRDRRFSADVKWRSVSDFKLSHVSTSNQCGVREGRHVERDQKDQFVLFAPLSGAITITQNNREVIVPDGSIGLFNLRSPSIWQHKDPSHVLNMVIPGEILRDRLSSSARQASFPHVVSSGLGRMSRALLFGLWSELHGISEGNADVCAGYLVALAALAIEGGESNIPLNQEAARAALYHRCTSYIRRNLDVPDLGPAMIANHVGISVRYLHQIFTATDQTVCGYIRDVRLKKCYAELSRPQAHTLPISEIAWQSGFRNPSHFATAFKRRYGLSPKECQRMAHQPAPD